MAMPAQNLPCPLPAHPTETWECEWGCGWDVWAGPLYVADTGEVICRGCSEEHGVPLVAVAEVECAEHGGALVSCRACRAADAYDEEVA